MRRKGAHRLFVAMMAFCAGVGGLSAVAASPASAKAKAESEPDPAVGSVVEPARRDEVLGAGWRASKDRAWTTTGDADGLHVLVADASSGYEWRTAASLSEPGFEVDQWVGNACVTGSGDRLVVAYAPRTFTNEEELASRGGFVAIVDLGSGAVTKLPVRSTLAYFSPGCGAGESAVVTQSLAEPWKTRLVRVDAASAKADAAIEVPGELSSAVPVGDGIVAADSHSLVRVAADGRRTLFAPSVSVPFGLTPDAEGGVVFQDLRKDRAFVRRVAGNGEQRTLAAGTVSKVRVSRGAAGAVFLTGVAKDVGSLPSSVRRLDVPATAEVSTLGEFAVTSVAQSPPTGDPHAARSVSLGGKSLATGKTVDFTVDPAAVLAEQALSGRNAHPATALAAAAAGSPSNPVDDERFCSVPRGDARNQALQPKPRQVEWAVDQAVSAALQVQREANWKNLGMPAYKPQTLFPPVALLGGGTIPAQIVLGIAAQESNLWQATGAALPGMTANPLIGNFYGRSIYDANTGDDWDIHWDKADCGYGVLQLTDGMRLRGHEKPNETALPYNTQRAVALDFAANIAAGVRLLAEKWNTVHAAGMKVNNGNPASIENWFFAVWAYNSGFHADPKNGGPWGLGWLNNPVNPRYRPDRDPFLEYSYDDARHPQDWPYPEKVIGWAGHPINTFEGPNAPIGGYRQAWWNDEQYRQLAKPPRFLFCDSSNECTPGAAFTPSYPGNPPGGDGDVRGEPAGPCGHKTNGLYDLQCWYHQSVEWKSCPNQCGHELLRFDPGYAYQDDGTSYPPNCTLAGLPNAGRGVLVIDDVPDGTPSIRPGCGHPWTNSGGFSLDFASDSTGAYTSKVDFHQAGAGFGGHFWFSHTYQQGAEGDKMRVTGTWTAGEQVNGWARVLVHLPDVGAHTQQATYLIDTGTGAFARQRTLSQGIEANRWVSAGVYQFSGTPRIRLSNRTFDGFGEEDVAWDAVAFQPLPEKPQHLVAALGDSYASGEGVGGYARETDAYHGKPRWNACRRSKDAWPRAMTMPGQLTPVGALTDMFSDQAELGFVACSGAWTNNLQNVRPASWSQPERYETGNGQFREVGQTVSGVLDENTTLVTLAIGGNDGNGFTDAVMSCINPFGYCNLPEGSTAFRDSFHSVVDATQKKIENVIRLIHSSGYAPNARILLVGYPRLINPGERCGPVGPLGSTRLAELAEYMSAQQEATATRLRVDEKIPVESLAVLDAFAGRGACSGTLENLNGPSAGPRGDGDNHPGDRTAGICLAVDGLCLSRESFHPNVRGAQAYTLAVNAKLKAMGYNGN